MNFQHLKQVLGFVLLLMIILLLFINDKASGHTAETYNEILKTLKYPEKLILDISKATADIAGGKIQRVEESGLVMTPLVMSLNPGSLNLTRVYPFPHTKFVDHPTLILDRLLIQNASLTQPFKVDIPYDEVALLRQEPSLTTIVYPWQTLTYSDQLVAEIKSFKARQKNVKIAVLTGHFFGDPFGPIDIADVIILKVPSVIDMVQYSDFLGYFTVIRDHVKPNIRKQNRNCSIFIYFSLEAFQERASFQEIELARYFQLILKASVAWINSREEEGIILDGFKWNRGEINWFDEEFEMKTMMELSFFGSWQVAACRLSTALETITTTFSSVFIGLESMKVISNISSIPLTTSLIPTECKPALKELPVTLSKLQFAVFITVEDPEIGVAVNQYLDIDAYTNINYNLVIFDMSSLQNKPAIPPHQLRRQLDTAPNNTKIGCAVGYIEEILDEAKLLNETNRKFKSLVNQTDFTLVWLVNIGADAIKQLQNIQQASSKVKDELKISEILIFSFAGYGTLIPGDSLYCDPVQQEYNVGREAVVNFGRIHGLSIVTGNAFSRFKYAWWSLIEPQRVKVDKQLADDVLLVARNYPKFYTIPGFQTDPCISSWALKADEAIPLYPSSSGITLFLDGLVSGKEVETLLLFTVHKFSLIEIIPGTYPDTILTLKVLASLSSKKLEGKHLYLRFDGELLTESGMEIIDELLKELSKLTTKLEGIHCANCTEKLFLNPLFLGMTNFVKKTGLELDNCLQNVERDFESLSKLEIFPVVDYLLCNSDYVDGKQGRMKATTNDKLLMQNFLDRNLLARHSHQKVYKNQSKELLFRLNHDPYYRYGEDKGTTKNYLEFIADVNQYAKAYQLKFFMGAAFDGKNKSRFGWWKIANFENLANVSVFIEKESEFYKRETWRPSFDEDDVPSSIFSSLAFTIGTTITVTVLAVFVAVILPFLWYRRKFAFMTREEVEFFLNGKQHDSNEQSTIEAGEVAEYLKFPKEYEILATNFLLMNILGQGNFGAVHKAQLQLEDGPNTNQFVAVKMPLPGCSKESFKSMLSELKVLCYVGNHPNVIQFIGAYIKEIGKGKVYIATEMCENGALINYLRNLQSGTRLQEEPLSYENVLKTNHSDEEIDLLTQLNRFSYEICLGMEYLGKKKIIHADLSARNVLLDSNLSCKIGDFGLSRKLYEYQKYVKKSQEPLPWRWMALESLKMMEFTTKSDVWSYGVTIWEIYSLGGVPYPGLSWTINFVGELENGLRLTMPDKATDLIYEKMISCWNPNPEERPTFRELASFFQDLRDLQYVPMEDIII